MTTDRTVFVAGRPAMREPSSEQRGTLMPSTEHFYLPCKISRGGFSSEYIFRVSLASGGEHAGAAPVTYFFDKSFKPLGLNAVARGETVDGLIAARPLGKGQGQEGTALVSVP